MTGSVTVVLATYDRPDALRAAIRSVVWQTHGDWRLLVVGDRCDARTGEVVSSFADGRIAYVNLPARFGEQSGPNSVGLAWAAGTHVAFLNHDDVWFPDHLARALRAMADRGTSFFVGRSAYACEVREAAPGTVVPLFAEERPSSRDPHDAFDGAAEHFEPCSAWVVRTDLARRIGPWRRAAHLHRSPLVDWFLRALGHHARFGFGDEITVLRLGTHNAAGRGGSYAASSPEHEYVTRWLGGTPLEEVRSALAGEIAAARARASSSSPGRRRPIRRLRRHIARLVFRATGVDAHDLGRRLLRRPSGQHLRHLCRIRTGMDLPDAPSVAAVLHHLRAQGRGPPPTRPGPPRGAGEEQTGLRPGRLPGLCPS